MKKLSPYLTFAGTIPFIACAILITMHIDAVIAMGTTAEILSAYGLVIATFMAGSQWGSHLLLTEDNPWALKLPIFSNLITIILWLGFLTLSEGGFLWLLLIGFICLFIIDYTLNEDGIITDKYLKSRKYVTVIVVISLIISALQL